MLDNYISVAEACKITGLKEVQVRRLCVAGILIAKKIGRAWVILRSSAEAYQKRRPGLKLGQKINRKKKHD